MSVSPSLFLSDCVCVRKFVFAVFWYSWSVLCRWPLYHESVSYLLYAEFPKHVKRDDKHLPCTHAHTFAYAHGASTSPHATHSFNLQVLASKERKKQKHVYICKNSNGSTANEKKSSKSIRHKQMSSSAKEKQKRLTKHIGKSKMLFLLCVHLWLSVRY